MIVIGQPPRVPTCSMIPATLASSRSCSSWACSRAGVGSTGSAATSPIAEIGTGPAVSSSIPGTAASGDIRACAVATEPRKVKATAADGKVKEFETKVRIDTPQEILYYENGGILQYVLRQLAGK